MPRKEQGWVTFQTSEDERKILEEFCEQSQRTKTEILRELVRSLNQHSSAPILPITQQEKQEETYAPKPDMESNIQKKSLKVSSRNILKGVVKRVIYGAVNSEVTLEIIHKVELTSIITRASAEGIRTIRGKRSLCSY
ncbi:TOBE domain-containing protein [Nostoc commune]